MRGRPADVSAELNHLAELRACIPLVLLPEELNVTVIAGSYCTYFNKRTTMPMLAAMCCLQHAYPNLLLHMFTLTKTHRCDISALLHETATPEEVIKGCRCKHILTSMQVEQRSFLMQH